MKGVFRQVWSRVWARSVGRTLPVAPMAGWTAAAAQVALVLSTSATAAEWRNDSIARLDFAKQWHDGQVQKSEATVTEAFAVSFDSAWSLSSIARIRFDGADRLEPGRIDQEARSRSNRRWWLGERGEVELRELYLDGRVGALNLRVGKQQVVWGQADGLRVLDVVNPFSFREFVIPDAQDRRIPLWSVRADLALGATALQLLWLPDPTFDEIPSGDAPFAITTPLLLPRANPAVAVQVAPLHRPAQTLANSDGGLRWATAVGRWDLTLNYLYHFYDDPVPTIGFDGSGVTVTPEYRRTHLIGGTFANAFGSTTLRGEAGYSTSRWFVTEDPLDADRVIGSPEISWVVGVDNTALTNTLLSLQYFQSTLVDSPSGVVRDRTERQLTALIQRRFANDAVSLRALWLHRINRSDNALSARIAWQVADRLSIAASVDLFSGDRIGLFGEFQGASRWGLHVEWGT